MKQALLGLLGCPACRGPLSLTAQEERRARLESETARERLEAELRRIGDSRARRWRTSLLKVPGVYRVLRTLRR